MSNEKGSGMRNSSNETLPDGSKQTTKLNVSKDLAAAAGFNVETPIVNAIIGNITGSLPTKKNDLKEMVKCKLCDCEVSSAFIMNSHLNGSKHKKKLKALGFLPQLKDEKGIHADFSAGPGSFRCAICSITVNSPQQLEVHLLGSKHKKNVEKLNNPEMEGKRPIEFMDKASVPSPAKKKKKTESKHVVCMVCNLVLNSQLQYEEHLSAKKHKLKSLKTNNSGRNLVRPVNTSQAYNMNIKPLWL